MVVRSPVSPSFWRERLRLGRAASAPEAILGVSVLVHVPIWSNQVNPLERYRQRSAEKHPWQLLSLSRFLIFKKAVFFSQSSGLKVLVSHVHSSHLGANLTAAAWVRSTTGGRGDAQRTDVTNQKPTTITSAQAIICINLLLLTSSQIFHRSGFFFPVFSPLELGRPKQGRPWWTPPRAHSASQHVAGPS